MLAFAGFSIIVLISFVLTCLPVQLSTEGGRADERAVHIEPYAFCIDDTALVQETVEEEADDAEEPSLMIST
ncbi:MAG TPA: hypothetical protein VLI90_06010, partial [Tepidisphaeraceae bacterium]|nr:hypothetical protein [Tepidisphaeraceae bacterium]